MGDSNPFAPDIGDRPSKGIKSFLSAKEKEELVIFLAATGENYDRYLEYCSKREWKPYSKNYLHTWVNRHRHKIKIAREENNERIRRLATFNREKRISELETDINRINKLLAMADKSAHTCDRCGEAHMQMKPDDIIRLSEQKRKGLQAIAQERNEWQKPDTNPTGDGLSVRDRLAEAINSALTTGQETKIIDGKAIVVAGN